MPNDKDASALRQQIDQAKKDAAGAVAMDAKKQIYVKQMAAARTAFAQKRYDEALQRWPPPLKRCPTTATPAAFENADRKKRRRTQPTPSAAGQMEAEKKREFTRQMLARSNRNGRQQIR